MYAQTEDLTRHSATFLLFMKNKPKSMVSRCLLLIEGVLPFVSKKRDYKLWSAYNSAISVWMKIWAQHIIREKSWTFLQVFLVILNCHPYRRWTETTYKGVRLTHFLPFEICCKLQLMVFGQSLNFTLLLFDQQSWHKSKWQPFSLMKAKGKVQNQNNESKNGQVKITVSGETWKVQGAINFEEQRAIDYTV